MTYPGQLPLRQGNDFRAAYVRIITQVIDVRSISPEPLRRLSWNITQIILSVRRCAESLTQSQGRPSMPCDLPFSVCPLNISLILWTIFIILHPNVPLCEAVSQLRILKFKVTLLGHGIFLDFRVLQISSTICYIFIKQHANVPVSELVCRTHDSAMQTLTQCHTSRSWDSAAEDMVAPQIAVLYSYRSPILTPTLNYLVPL